MPNQPTLYYVVIALVALLIGLSKGGIGQVLGVLITPLLTFVMPVTQAVALALPLLIFGDLFSLWAFWKKWDMRYIRLMLPTAVIGIVIGTLLLTVLPDIALRRILGIMTLLYVVYRLLADRLKALAYQPRNWHGVAAGGAAGVGSALANVGALFYTVYMLLQPVEPVIFAGTATLFFFIINILKIPGFIVAGLFDLNLFLQVAWLLPLIPIGVFIGRWLVNRMPQKAFEQLMLVILTLAALVLIFVYPE
jgi:hypothetical protein